jgi:hypothetical protein
MKITGRRAVFFPRVMGIFTLLIIILALTAGALRQELALILTGAIFLTLWVYCLLMTLLLAFIHRRRARRAFIHISPRSVAAGELAEAVYSEEEGAAFTGSIFYLPGIAVRCRLLLAAKDVRRIQYDFNPHSKDSGSVPRLFTAEKRGAYFSTGDEFAVFDILGFFCFIYRLPVHDTGNARLLVSPHAAAEPPTMSAHAGESMLPPEFSFQRTDNLTNHRPYIPGDDPRRINWKLYGHGGGLFVREGEYEPPPQSSLVILIDTEYDPLLYTAAEARKGIDLLCENALAAVFACTESGMDVLIGYSGGTIRGRNVSPLPAPGLAALLAWPAASPLPDSLDLPEAPGKYGILILALPRSGAETSGLDRFLNGVTRRSIDLLFLYDGAVFRSEAPVIAEACTALYNRRPGIRAKAFGV